MLFDENIYFAGLTVSVMLLTNIELFCRQRLESFTGSRSEDRGVSQCAKRRRGVSGCVCVCAHVFVRHYAGVKSSQDRAQDRVKISLI